jgi:hypothetical protein
MQLHRRFAPVLAGIVVILGLSDLMRSQGDWRGAQTRSGTPAILTAFCQGPVDTPTGTALLFGLGQTMDVYCDVWNQGGESETFDPMPMPSSGTLLHLTAVSGTPGFVGRATLTVLVNGVASALSCSMSNSGSPITPACRDAVHFLAVHTGDTVALQVTNTSEPGQNGLVGFQVTIEKR